MLYFSNIKIWFGLLPSLLCCRLEEHILSKANFWQSKKSPIKYMLLLCCHLKHQLLPGKNTSTGQSITLTSTNQGNQWDSFNVKIAQKRWGQLVKRNKRSAVIFQICQAKLNDQNRLGKHLYKKRIWSLPVRGLGEGCKCLPGWFVARKVSLWQRGWCSKAKWEMAK